MVMTKLTGYFLLTGQLASLTGASVCTAIEGNLADGLKLTVRSYEEDKVYSEWQSTITSADITDFSSIIIRQISVVEEGTLGSFTSWSVISKTGKQYLGDELKAYRDKFDLVSEGTSLYLELPIVHRVELIPSI